MTCQALVERITDYLEDALPPDERARVERHLSGCDGCTAYLAQMHAALRVAATLPPERLSDAAGERVVREFRAWAAQHRGA